MKTLNNKLKRNNQSQKFEISQTDMAVSLRHGLVGNS